jgi:hypothetical protein
MKTDNFPQNEPVRDIPDSPPSVAASNKDSIHHCATGFDSLPLPLRLGGHEMLNNHNILQDIITDEQYQSLRRLGMLNEKVLRDFHIRTTFKELRTQHLSAHQAIEHLQRLYPYLQFDTLRKIVYQINDRSSASII